MTRDVLMAPKAEQQPVSETKVPKTHREWSGYPDKHGDITSGRRR